MDKRVEEERESDRKKNVGICESLYGEIKGRCSFHAISKFITQFYPEVS